MTFDQWFEKNVIRVHSGVGSLAIRAMKESYQCVWDAAIQSKKAKGDIVVTKNPSGEIVLVSRQDEDGRILSVIAERGFTEDQLQTLEQAKSILNVRTNKG